MRPQSPTATTSYGCPTLTTNEPNNDVLIVDDDTDISEALDLILQSRGYHCVFAADGAEALDYLRAHPLPRVVLLDMMMPGMNGKQFRDEQLVDPRLAAVPVVVMTGDSRAGAKAADLGVAKFLRKPVSINDLLAAVQDPTDDAIPT
jgi:CheY-like chemotaxis protein